MRERIFGSFTGVQTAEQITAKCKIPTIAGEITVELMLSAAEKQAQSETASPVEASSGETAASAEVPAEAPAAMPSAEAIATPTTQENILRVDAGRTKGDKFFLFSYRTFSIPDSALDPVVVGMTFTARRHGVTVEADVSGEQTGDIILSLPSKTVADSDEELLAQACESARKLCESAEAVAAALANPSRASSESIS